MDVGLPAYHSSGITLLGRWLVHVEERNNRSVFLKIQFAF
jgi:hypothetical protein